MQQLFATLERMASADANVLLLGETGTGKEVAAEAIHAGSARAGKPFVVCDLAGVPRQLMESELFGHVRGAFTGASATRQGAFMRASGGTLFLDELASVSLPVQARLLRVLEERRVRAVGSDVEREVDVRIVGASRADLAARVAEGTFRPDLYYRLSVVRVVLPPHRARREDIAPIAAEILRMRGIEPGPVEGPGLHRLVAHAWLGNARELRNVIDRALALRPRAASFADLVITLSPAPSDDPLAIRSDLPFGEAKQAIVDAFEERYLRDVLAREGGNISAAARAADVDRKHLRSLLHKHGLIADDDQD